MAFTPTLKIYSASGWPYRADVALINARLEASGPFKVMSTWITAENGDNCPDMLAKDAQRDTDEVGQADVLVAHMHDTAYAYRGTFTEMGHALALRKKVIVVCSGMGTETKVSDTRYNYPYACMTNVFFWHPEIYARVKTLDEAIDLLRALTPTQPPLSFSSLQQLKVIIDGYEHPANYVPSSMTADHFFIKDQAYDPVLIQALALRRCKTSVEDRKRVIQMTMQQLVQLLLDEKVDLHHCRLFANGPHGPPQTVGGGGPQDGTGATGATGSSCSYH